MFYFAWVDKADSTFNPATHTVVDEPVFRLQIEHSEGDFASAEVDIRNPRVGLLTSSRKQWAWISYRDESNAVQPLFFGRLVAVPKNMEGDVVRLTFVARPADYEERRQLLADSLKVAPWWDPLWFSEEDAEHPDSVLESRGALWHIDRVTHQVTTSDIISGEAGTVAFGGGDVFAGSVSVSYSTSPARLVVVDAQAQWEQVGVGDIDITRLLLNEFEKFDPPEVYAVDGGPRPKKGTVNLIGGETMVEEWPEFGQQIGGGWTVGESFATTIGDPPLPPILTDIDAFGAIESWDRNPAGPALRILFDRAPGFVITIDNPTPTGVGWGYTPWGVVHKDISILWIPIWQIAVKMKLHYEAARQRTESLHFTIGADVQPLLTDPNEEEIIRLSFGPADVDDAIGDVRRHMFFATDRGHTAIENLIMRARAHLLARARAVDVSFGVSFEAAAALSCRHSATVTDPRIPGGEATGKVKGYALFMDGDTGSRYGVVTIGCTIGRDGTVEEITGTPSYVADGYVDSGWQEYTGAAPVLPTNDTRWTITDYALDDDGVNLFNVTPADHLTGLTITGGLDLQMQEVQSERYANPVAAIDKINGYKTTVTLTMRPVEHAPFTSTVTLGVVDLKVPRTINLEDEGP